MSTRSSIFRESALDRLSSPEQLDELIHITDPRGWFALAVLGVLLLAAVVWGVLGRIPTKVEGSGILIRGAQLFKVASVGAGQLAEIKVNAGNVVTQNQVVAILYQPGLADQITSTMAQLDEAKKQSRELAVFASTNSVQETELIALKHSNLNQLIKDYSEQLLWLTEKMASQEKLVQQGLITKQTLLGTKQTFYQTQQRIDDARSELKQLSNREFQLKNQQEQDLFNSQVRINEIQRKLKELTNQLELTSKVLSPQSGRVLEVTAKPGDLLTAGAPLLSLELSEKDLQAVVYVSGAEGKKVQAGMQVQIVPSTYQKAEYGFIVGQVRYVADFPATRQAMMTVLENEQLVQNLSSAGAPIAIYAELIKDPRTASKFRWSSSEGPPAEIHAGTLCAASVVVAERRPISMVLPAIKEFFGF